MTCIIVICQGPTIHMMTDINIWSVGLTPQQVTSWMTCEDDPELEENRIVDWLTANWTLEGVEDVHVSTGPEPVPRPPLCRLSDQSDLEEDCSVAGAG